jgi:hypothetical protein
MNHSSTNVSTITAIVLALGIVGSTAVNAFLMTTTPAYAVSTKDKVIERQQGVAGSATWNDISLDVPGIGTVVYADLFVIESEWGITDIAVFLITEEGNFVEAFTTTDQNVFDTDKKLTSATLSPVTYEVFVFDEFGNFIQTSEITIQATWEGTGDLNKQRFSLHEKSDDFSVKSKDKVLFREATAEASINNANLGTSDDANFYAFKNVVMTVSESIISWIDGRRLNLGLHVV